LSSCVKPTKKESTKKYTRGGAPLHELCSLSLVFL
jgi:hypothetical protein